MLDARTPLLAVKDLQAWYGESHILHGVTFDVHEGEVVTLLGGILHAWRKRSCCFGEVFRRFGVARIQCKRLLVRLPGSLRVAL